MEYGGEVALDYSVMKNNGQGMGNLSELNRLSIKSEYSASAFKVVQPKANSDYG